MLNIIQNSFAECYKPGQKQTVDKAMIAFKGRLSYVQYIHVKPIKRGIKVLMCCDPDTAYLQ